jgi:hypothetical protein
MARNQKEKLAMEVLQAGGYFRKQLERQYHGREQFQYRLREANGAVVKGVGFQTWRVLHEAGLLAYKPCEKSSVWPEEWKLAE